MMNTKNLFIAAALVGISLGASGTASAQSNTAGGSVSIVVPAFGSVTLPAQGATAPVVTMLDLPTNQDACKNATFALSYGGTGTRA